MKNNKLAISIIALIFVLILGGFLAYGYYQRATYKITRPVVSMQIEGYGTVKIELYPDMAPNTVENFIKLINEGYYNGLTFNNVEETLIQSENTEESEYTINGEFSRNGYKENELKFERGTVGIYREDYTYYASLDSNLIQEGYNSGYADFFIMLQDEEERNGYYTAFGKIIEGMEIVDKIAKLETKIETNKETGETIETTEPVNAPVISNVTVDTFGVEYGQPEVKERFDINSFVMEKIYGISY